MNIISWKIEAINSWGCRDMSLRLKRASSWLWLSYDFITKTWLSKFMQVARLMAYQIKHQIGTKISTSLVGNLSLAKMAYPHDSLFCDMKWISKVAFPEILRMMSLEVTEIQDQPPPCNSVTLRLISLKFSGNFTFDIYFTSQNRYFFFKSTLRLSCRYATFARLRSPKY